jgi:hypothetical protein
MPENVRSVEDNCVEPKLNFGLGLTSSPLTLKTTSEETSMQRLQNLNPGNQVPPTIQSNQTASGHVLDEQILDNQTDSDNDYEIVILLLMEKLQNSCIELLKRNTLSLAKRKAQYEGKPDDLAV